MSVTVGDLLKLPSLRRAEVLGGRKGLAKIVSSISVLESTNPDILVDGLFPQGEFFGSEIVITGFMNILDDVECQCANIRRMAEGGEAGLILFYVGVYLPDVDQRLIDLADELDFVLICMPKGEKNLRYSEVICDVMDCISRDHAGNESIVSEILERVSVLPPQLRSVNTVLQMVSDRMKVSLVLCDSSMRILNLVAWPRSLENVLKNGMKECRTFPGDQEFQRCPFLDDSYMGRVTLHPGHWETVELFLVYQGLPEGYFPRRVVEQITDVVRLGVNIWGQQHSEVAVHELVHAIIQDEPMKMRRLAEIFRIDVEAIHEMWIVCGERESAVQYLKKEMGSLRTFAESCADTVVADIYEGKLLLFLSNPYSQKEAEEQITGILGQVSMAGEAITLTRCNGLGSTGDVRKAYLCHRDYLADSGRVFPGKRYFQTGELQFVKECRELAERGEEEVQRALGVLDCIRADREAVSLLDTLSIYLLEGDSSVTKTAERMYLHRNTIKYRIHRLTELLGYRPDKMPEGIALYRAVVVRRLLC